MEARGGKTGAAKRRRGARRHAPRPGPDAGMESRRPLSRPQIRGGRRPTWPRPAPRPRPFRSVSGQARGAGRRTERGWRRPSCAYESAERHAGQARLLRGPALRRGHGQSRAREILRRHPGEAHRHHHRPDLLRAGDQQDRRRGAGARAARCRRWPATSPGSTTCARRSPISSRRSSSGCSTKSRSRRAARWNRLFNETMTALRFEVDGEKEPLALEPTSTS